MALHQLFSLQEIDALAAGLDLPGPDVVLVGLDSRRDAPAALERLELHQAQHDWRTVNLTQVRVASSLVSLMMKAERRLERVARAIKRMKLASDELEDVGMRLQRHYGCAGMVGAFAINLAGNPKMGRLEAANEDINNLLHGELAKASAQRWKGMNEDMLLTEMEQALVKLYDRNCCVERRIRRFDRVVGRLEPFQKMRYEVETHALSAVDRQFHMIVATFYPSLRELVGYLDSGVKRPIKLTNACQQKVTAQLDMALGLNYERFSGVLHVKSLRDLDEVFNISMPHQGEVGLPARRVDVQLRGLNVLSDGNALAVRVAQGMEERGWTVQGLNALTTARELDHKLIVLRTALGHLRHVIGPLGHVLDPASFNNVEDQAGYINNMVFGGDRSLVCAEVGQLMTMLLDIVKISRSDEPSLMLSRAVCNALIALGLVRGGEVFFGLA